MTEEEAVFDPSLKKKKKKKKTPFDLEAALENEGGGGGAAQVAPSEKPAAAAAAANEVESGGGGGGSAAVAVSEQTPLDEDLDLESLAKKKKKKKKVLGEDGLGGGGGEEQQQHEQDEAGAASSATQKPLEEGEDLDLESLGKKKKKKKKDALNMDDVEGALDEVAGGEHNNEELDLESFGKKKKKKKRPTDTGLDDDKDKENEATTAWIDSDRDYTYDELLQRVFNIMRDKNPEVVAGEKKKFVMRPPQVVRVGTKKTAFVNFTEIAKMLHRQPKHLSDFLSAELGTVGAVDGNNQLIMKGRFQQKHIENVLRRYIKEYVTCHTCRSPDTILNKEARLFFLQCMTCHSRCSVQTIKTGFQAVTGKRSAIRAKQ